MRPPASHYLSVRSRRTEHGERGQRPHRHFHPGHSDGQHHHPWGQRRLRLFVACPQRDCLHVADQRHRQHSNGGHSQLLSGGRHLQPGTNGHALFLYLRRGHLLHHQRNHSLHFVNEATGPITVSATRRYTPSPYSRATTTARWARQLTPSMTPSPPRRRSVSRLERTLRDSRYRLAMPPLARRSTTPPTEPPPALHQRNTREPSRSAQRKQSRRLPWPPATATVPSPPRRTRCTPKPRHLC